MKHFKLQKHTDKKEIFSGYYPSFIACLEDAVDKKTDLSYIDLKNTNLSNANLDNACMPFTDFTGANLTGANMSEATLTASIFYNCSLFNTCLSYSGLNNCDFRGANFGATLTDGANIQNCIFSTLSCFDLEFCYVRHMDGCVFVADDGALHKMSQQPIVLKGFLNNHIIIFDQTVKIGVKFFPKEVLPNLLSMLSSYGLTEKRDALSARLNEMGNMV